MAPALLGRRPRDACPKFLIVPLGGSILCSYALGGFLALARRAALGRGAVLLALDAVRAARSLGAVRCPWHPVRARGAGLGAPLLGGPTRWLARRSVRVELAVGLLLGRRCVRGALWRSFVGALLRWGCFRGRYARELASPTLSAVAAVRGGVAGGRGPGDVSDLQQGPQRVRGPLGRRRIAARAPEAAGSGRWFLQRSLDAVAEALWR